MGKRSQGQFERSKNDLYDTPEKGVKPLLPLLAPGTRFIEPCFGNGHLAEHLMAAGHILVGAYDINPQHGAGIADATEHSYFTGDAEYFITNPPWSRDLLHKIIHNLSRQLPTWLLFDAGWACNLRHVPILLRSCRVILAVGRLKWIEDSKHQGKDDAAWYLFDARHEIGPRFYGRGQVPGEKIEAEKPPPDPEIMHSENRARFERVMQELSPLSSDQQLQRDSGYRFS